MKLYDISQEVFSCVVFPGDPAPEAETLLQLAKGDVCNLTAIRMCAHNGTHVDAPAHFLKDGNTIEQIPLEYFIGPAFVAEHDGIITAQNAREILETAGAAGNACQKRILIKGKATLSLEAAEVLAQAEILLFGNESQTVGPEDAPAAVHHVLLGKNIVLLEGIRLHHVPQGRYLLNTAPLNLGGLEGAPCRSVLLDFD